MTLLLRHKARQERIPISDAGWVRMDHLLGWQGMRRYGLGRWRRRGEDCGGGGGLGSEGGEGEVWAGDGG